MKSFIKKLVLFMIIISAVNVSASWYNPEFISKMSSAAKGYLARTLASFGLAQQPSVAKSNYPLDNLQAMIRSGLMQPSNPAHAIVPSGPKAVDHVESAEQFQKIIDEYLEAIKPEFTQANNWFASGSLTTELPTRFIPFVQKADIPEGSIVVFHGDLHGNYLALQEYIKTLAAHNYIDADTLEIINKQFYMVFLGDYADRGPNGVDVYSTLMQLKMKNQSNVFLLRGNHEDLNIQLRYGFVSELASKFGAATENLLIPLNELYNSLPDALYLRIGNKTHNEYIMCCHGLWEFGYDPALFLLNDTSSRYQAFNLLQRKTFFERIKNNPKKQALATNIEKSGLKLDTNIIGPKSSGNGGYALGFLWDDVQADTAAPSYFNPNRGMIWSQKDIIALRNLLKQENIDIKIIIRAHQHGDQDLWTPETLAKKYAKSGIVYTLLAAPNPGYPNNVDTWGQLRVGDSYKESVLTIKTNKYNVGAVK